MSESVADTIAAELQAETYCLFSQGYTRDFIIELLTDFRNRINANPRLRAALALLAAVEAEPRARRSSPGKGGHDRLLARLRAVIAEAEKP